LQESSLERRRGKERKEFCREDIRGVYNRHQSIAEQELSTVIGLKKERKKRLRSTEPTMMKRRRDDWERMTSVV